MSEQVLERKRITTAGHQIFPGERVAEHVNTCFQNASFVVVVCDGFRAFSDSIVP